MVVELLKIKPIWPRSHCIVQHFDLTLKRRAIKSTKFIQGYSVKNTQKYIPKIVFYCSRTQLFYFTGSVGISAGSIKDHLIFSNLAEKWQYK